MDAADVFRQGLGSVVPQQNHHQPPPQYPQQRQQQPGRSPPSRDDVSESDGSSHRIAHTLTACCRCRQRKTRCDPTLPRCLPCERSGSTCEYFDTSKGRKISRFYVIKLQEKVRALEAELSQYTDEEHDYPRNSEDMVRRGGLVKLNETDETPRYLGPSSGIAMTRLLMEEAKLFTDSKRISELIPEVRARRQARMQSIVMTTPGRKKSYPMISAHPAQNLPTRPIVDKLVEVFCSRAQMFWPAVHEKVFARDLEDVYGGNTDPYKNFVVRIVIAISLQKLDPQYAGLADSYYLAAMQFFEDVVRPKDLKTLQCLVLIGQYSLLTPTRTAVYFVIGLATRICQQEGLADEKTITSGYSHGLVDPLTMDLRRRLSWIVASMEFGLAHSMGRPNGFAKGNDIFDVQFFATVDDEYITEEGILPGPPSEKKLVAVHFFRMRMVQAEIRRTLYEKKRAEPRDDSHPWYAGMERMIHQWLNDSPEQPAWCKPWFTGRFHQMMIFLYRPSPQVPKPSGKAAIICYDGAVYIINLSKQQMEKAAVDITWVFLLNLYMALNTVLWSVSYADVRQVHAREDAEELINVALDILDQCTERWPGTASASQLYSIFAKACLQSYEASDATPKALSSGAFNTPTSLADSSPQQGGENSASAPGSQPQQFPLNPPPFGYVFDATRESMATYPFDNSFPPPQPTFRSNSIFFNPSTTEPGGRRPSYFPPEMDDLTPPSAQDNSPPMDGLTSSLPTPPESLAPQNANLSPQLGIANQTPTMSQASPSSVQSTPVAVPASTNMSPPPLKQQHPQPPQRAPTFTIPAPQQNTQQRPLPPPQTITDWFSPPPPFISPYAFSSMSSSFFSDASSGHGGFGGPPGLGINQLGIGPAGGSQFTYTGERHGSLSQEQQLELMDVLENEGMDDINAFLNLGAAGPAPPTAPPTQGNGAVAWT